jgi:uncharacterized protein (TIGR02466 family)
MDKGKNNYETHAIFPVPVYTAFLESVDLDLANAAVERTGVMKLDVKFNITQSWINRNPRNTSHAEHTHRNSIWNCVIFLKDHDIPMEFRDPNPWKDLWDMDDQTQEASWANTNISKFYPEAGKMIIFPHYVHHSVGVNPYMDERMSLAFNTWFGSSFGNYGSLTLTRTHNE